MKTRHLLIMLLLCFRAVLYAQDTLNVDISDQEINQATVDVPVSIVASQPINSVDFSMEFDNKNLSFKRIKNHTQNLNWSYNLISDSIIRFTSFSSNPIPNDIPFISIEFDSLLKKINPSDIKEMMTLFNGVSHCKKIVSSMCQGDSTKLSAKMFPGETVLWSTGETTKSIYALSAGNFYATITGTNGLTRKTPVYKISVYPLPDPTISLSGPATFCQGGSVTLGAIINSSYSYAWNTGATTSSIVVADISGQYSVSITDSNGCAAVAQPVSVTINPIPGKQLLTSGPNIFCEGDSITISAEEGPGYSYIWSNGITNRTIKSDTTGSYFAEITNSFGCSVISDTVHTTVFQYPDDSVIISGPTTFCAGDSVILTAYAAGVYTYLWSNGADTRSVTLKESGNYSVTIRNAIGCTATSSYIEVLVNFLLSDLDRSGMVGVNDAIILQNKFGQECSCIEDMDKNGVVGVNDLILLMNDFGKSCG